MDFWQFLRLETLDASVSHGWQPCLIVFTFIWDKVIQLSFGRPSKVTYVQVCTVQCTLLTTTYKSRQCNRGLCTCPIIFLALIGFGLVWLWQHCSLLLFPSLLSFKKLTILSVRQKLLPGKDKTLSLVGLARCHRWSLCSKIFSFLFSLHIDC